MEFLKPFFTSEENDWGEVVYNPTTLGKITLVVIIAVLLVAAVLLAKMAAKKLAKSNNTSIKSTGMKLSAKQLAVCAMALALGTILSNIKAFSFPTGGSITPFSMLIISLPGYFFGLGAGIVTGVAYGVLQLVIDPYVLYPAQLIIDYILAFGALGGLSGLLYKKNNGLIPGYIAAVIGRYVFAVLSGWLFFGAWAWEGWDPFPYSLAYNAVYIFAEAAVTIAVLCIPYVRKGFEMIKREVNN